MEIFNDTKLMGVIIVVACLLVIGAMSIDLCAGLYKAKLRGEIRSSWGLKRSLSKFINYIGSLLIAAGVDLLIHFCKAFQLFHLDLLYGLPIITCVIAMFLLVVEFLSVREAADEKTKTEVSRVADLAAQFIKKEDLIEAVSKALLHLNDAQEINKKAEQNEVTE